MVNFNLIDKDYIVRWQFDLENTKENTLPVCDKPYHKIKENLPHLAELKNLWNYALSSTRLHKLKWLIICGMLCFPIRPWRRYTNKWALKASQRKTRKICRHWLRSTNRFDWAWSRSNMYENENESMRIMSSLRCDTNGIFPVTYKCVFRITWSYLEDGCNSTVNLPFKIKF